MKSLIPWFCLAATASSQVLYAADGLEAYRLGNYDLAAASLYATQSNDPVANYYLGKMRLYGYGQLKNDAIALRYFIQAGDKGYLPAQKLLANYYLIKAQKPDVAFEWFKKAAAAGDTPSQMFCAAAYLFGYGVKKNPDMARRYYIDAAKSGNAIAQYALGEQFLASRDSRNKKMGLIWLTKSSDQGNPKAQLMLSEMYLSGSFVRQDLEKAQTLAESAVNQNYMPAMVVLGELAQKRGDFQAALSWFSKAAKADNVTAQVALAQLYMQANTPLHDDKIAFEWMSKAAAKGSNQAQLALAKMYKDGIGVVADAKRAAEWEQAAKKAVSPTSEELQVVVAKWLTNDAAASLTDSGYQLGGIYNAWQNPTALRQNNYNPAPQVDTLTRQAIYQPQFTMVDPKDIAINDYFDILAPSIAGNASKWTFPRYHLDVSMENLLKGDSLVLRHDPATNYVERDITVSTDDPAEYDYVAQQMKQWLRVANYQIALNLLYGQAILGDSASQFELGQLLQYGVGVAKNIDQAIIYYQLAAQQQEVRAEYNLGVLYLEGRTTPVDYARGLEWMTDAAFKGNAYAQYVLASIYENGLTTADGVELIKPNHQQAMSMYYLSSSNHFGEAQYRLADLLVKEQNANLSVASKTNRIQLIKRLYQGAVEEGVAQANLPLAFFNAMDSDPAKQKLAFTQAQKEAKEGSSNGQMLLGMMYERGIATPADPVEATYWYQQASSNPVSAFILGTYYSEGKQVSKDIDKGKALLEQAANAGFSYADLNLAILQHQMGENFLPMLDKSRQLGNSKAGLLLADYYLSQANNPEKMKDARDIYQYFADKGDKDAQLKLGFLYDQGLGGDKNNELAARWYLASAQQGQPIAQYLVAQLYQLGKIGNGPDYAEAKKWYQLSQVHYVPASVALGFIYDTVDDNYVEAAKNYELAAQQGDAIAQFNLGLLYEYGKGRAVDVAKAKAYYDEAAAKGYAKAMTQLAGLYFAGINGAPDNEQAIKWYQQAAKLGDSNAIYQLGLLSETGVGTKLDFTEAIKFYQQAAQLGNHKAKLALARMYQYGIGMPQDYQQAAAIYKELAANNNAYAQYQLGLFYIEGRLGEPQMEQGKSLLKQASDNGNAQAQKKIQWLNAQQQPKVSFIEPAHINSIAMAANEAPEVMFVRAMSEWNIGNEAASRTILHTIVKQYPDYVPAKALYKQINQA